ncbi:MAG TPA: hypothetical protein VHX60_14200 [Acidobacteriaceae bacterium]|jgi:uncharacterized protein YxjI|nr:hypothetical protein [Acidobacteriaceae bacterium]
MDVTIQERKFTFHSEFEITGAGPALRARKEFLSFPPRIQVKFEGGQVVTLQGRFSLVRCKYDFHFPDGREYAFHCEKVVKGVYACRSDEEIYRLYHHKKRRYSIFHNGEQIAAVERSRYAGTRGNRFAVRMNHDADVAMVTSMVLAMNASDRSDAEDAEHGTPEPASYRREERPFDTTWQPN